jgi:hypothetical protein
MYASLPLELWFIVAESFLSKATLCSLCLVSKGLNAIFTPVLYKNISLAKGCSRWDEKLKKLWVLDSESCFQFTRHFEVGDTKLAPNVALDPQALRGLLEKMTGLKSYKIWYVLFFLLLRQLTMDVPS